MKIGMLIDAYDDSFNGALVSTKRFAEKLREKGIEVIFLTTGRPEPHKIIFPSFRIPFVQSILDKMKVPLAKPKKQILELALNGIDILHVQFPFMLGIKAVQVARKKNIPIVSTFHVQAENILKNINLRSDFLTRLLYRIFINKIYNLSDLVICPSEFAKEELTNYGLKSPSKVISNGILPVFSPKKVERSVLLKDKFILLTVGRMAKEKHQRLIINAVKKSEYSKKIQLVIIGDGPLKAHLKHLAKGLPVPPIIDSVANEQLREWYHFSDLYVHAGEIELEGMSTMEAMASGLPILVSNSKKSAVKQFALDKKSLFEAGNVQSLAQKIDFWVENEKERAQARLDYLEFSKKYSHEKSVEDLIEVYEECLSGRVMGLC